MTDHYSGSPYSRSSRLGSTARRSGPSAKDMMGVIIILLIFMLVFVMGYAVSMENSAALLERQKSNAENCIVLAREAALADDAAFLDYMADAQSALLFNDKVCR